MTSACAGTLQPATTAPETGQTKPEALPSPAASPATETKRRAIPFKSNIVSVNKSNRTFCMGKKKIRLVYVTTNTKLLTGDGKKANFENLVAGVEVRGSMRKRDDGEFEAASVKIGPKTAITAIAGDSTP